MKIEHTAKLFVAIREWGLI